MATWCLNWSAISPSQALRDVPDVVPADGVLLSQHEMNSRVHAPVLRIPWHYREAIGVPAWQPRRHSNYGVV